MLKYQGKFFSNERPQWSAIQRQWKTDTRTGRNSPPESGKLAIQTGCDDLSSQPPKTIIPTCP